MGREIRRVPPNWQHPVDSSGQYIALYKGSAEEVFEEWLSSWKQWIESDFEKTRAEHPNLGYRKNSPYTAFCDWFGMPPDPKDYCPIWTKKPTWYQVYETVSEGTPITPPFATTEELISHLATKGTDWDETPWSIEAARNFVERSHWLPSIIGTGEQFINQTQVVLGDRDKSKL